MRIKGLDILRAFAVLLVLFRHSELSNCLLCKIGWTGVDLFFVISGFLISGLLFNEYKHNNQINVKRFLIRRAFKIYPSFYFFIGVNIFYSYISNSEILQTNLLFSEIFYLQSYLPHIWDHTWSLAVEEHFYILFSFFLFFIIKMNFLQKKYLILGGLIFLFILSFIFRLIYSYPHKLESFFPFTQTHLRSDGIIVGIFISYLYYFTNFMQTFKLNKLFFLIVASILIVPPFLFEGGTFIMNTIGISMMNISFGIIVLLFLDIDKFINSINLKLLKKIVHLISFVGIHSYSIYIWHLTAKNIVEHFFHQNNIILTLLYFIVALLIGLFFSFTIEKYFLALRNKYGK